MSSKVGGRGEIIVFTIDHFNSFVHGWRFGSFICSKKGTEDKRLTESQVLEMLGLESIQSLIRKRKLQWVAHCARRGEEDLSWKRMVREVEDGKSKWGSRLKEDWKELGVNTVRGWCNKVKDRGWLASKLGTSKKKGRTKKKR